MAPLSSWCLASFVRGSGSELKGKWLVNGKKNKISGVYELMVVVVAISDGGGGRSTVIVAALGGAGGLVTVVVGVVVG